MFKRKINLLLIILMAFTLAACASLKLPGATSQSTGNQVSSSQNQPNPVANFANQPIESKLAIGTLKLEGSANAVTAAQAKMLLPLWKAVKSLSSSSTVSADEMTALYKQIQDAMTADQVTAIKNLSLSQSDIQTLSQKYGVQMPQPGANPQGTPVAKSSSNNNAGGFPGGGPGGGLPPDGGGPGAITGAQGQTTGQTTVQRTPRAGQASRGFGGGLNSMFVDPLIKLLEQRATA